MQVGDPSCEGRRYISSADTEKKEGDVVQTPIAGKRWEDE